MTDNENFALILKKLDHLNTDMQSMKDDMREVKDDIQTLKDDMRGVKDDVQTLKDDMRKVKNDIYTFKRQVRKSTSELKSMDKMILNEVERVHIILDNHIKNKALHSAWHHC